MRSSRRSWTGKAGNPIPKSPPRSGIASARRKRLRNFANGRGWISCCSASMSRHDLEPTGMAVAQPRPGRDRPAAGRRSATVAQPTGGVCHRFGPGRVRGGEGGHGSRRPVVVNLAELASHLPIAQVTSWSWLRPHRPDRPGPAVRQPRRHLQVCQPGRSRVPGRAISDSSSGADQALLGIAAAAGGRLACSPRRSAPCISPAGTRPSEYDRRAAQGLRRFPAASRPMPPICWPPRGADQSTPGARRGPVEADLCQSWPQSKAPALSRVRGARLSRPGLPYFRAPARGGRERGDGDRRARPDDLALPGTDGRSVGRPVPDGRGRSAVGECPRDITFSRARPGTHCWRSWKWCRSWRPANRLRCWSAWPWGSMRSGSAGGR